MKKQAKDNSRPPIVTIMGHVDHGKTTLLDTIRKTNVVAREHGGITQHIGAYQIIFQDRPITFIDTPGHVAFEKMRSRGSEIADIVVLVVAANDGVKPQTIEAIKHIKNAQKPLIVAITKTDLPACDITKIKKQLQAEDIIVESFGGQVPVVEVAAPKNKGISELLEMILLVWQLSPQPSLLQDPLEAIVVESFLDRNRGPVVTVVVKKGTLVAGQKITVDTETITVKALIDDLGHNINEALPSKPVEILGFKKNLEAGTVVRDLTLTKSQDTKQPKTVEDILANLEESKNRFKVIIKADVAGSLEAVISNLPENILVVSSGIGEINSSDIALAKIAHAPILVFNIKISNQVRSEAEREKVVIKNYYVIYELLSDLENIAHTFEEAKHELKISGRAKVIVVFDIDGKKIAGVKVTHGKLKINDKIILKRQNTKDHESKITSLKKFKKDVGIITSGQEGGIGTTPNLDVRAGDIIESLG